MCRRHWLIGLLILLIFLFFVLDLIWGSVAISAQEVWATVMGSPTDSGHSYIILNFRLPKALTALLAGAGISVAGLQMQSLFRNPIADTSILGINSGAGVGVAIYTMAFTLFPSLGAHGGAISSWGAILASVTGALVVLLMVTAVASRMSDMLSIMIVGVMVGFLASSVISILQFFSQEESLKAYLLWSFGSVSGTTWRQLSILAPVVLVGLMGSLLLPKQMNALALGDRYAQSVGIRVGRSRFMLIAITSLLTGGITAFTGPIAFLGMAVPHFVRLSFRTADHRLLIPASMLSGALLLLLCDLCTQLPGQDFVLPINAITALIGAPVVIGVVLGKTSS